MPPLVLASGPKPCGGNYLWRHIVDTKCCKITKWNISQRYFSIELKLFRVLLFVTKYHDKAHCDISMAMQWALVALYPKGKIRVFLPNKGYLLLMFIQWM